jgi:regulator of sigma D
MEPVTVATGLVAFLGPVLPYLIKGVEKVTEEISKKIGAAGWDKAKQIWGKLWPKIEARQSAKEAVEDVIANPDDTDAQGALRNQLKKILADDSDLLKDIAALLEAAGQKVEYHAELHGSGAIAQGKGAAAGGEGGIAISGNVGGNVQNMQRRNND